jgi:nitrate/TMAO reductase-like tetraheme cytochrome c subunit
MSEELPTPTPPLTRLGRLRNWLSLAGLVLAVSAFFAFVLLFSVDLFAAHANPYVGILCYVVAPMFLLMGLGMMFLGYVMESRRVRKGKPDTRPEFILHVDLSRKRDRRLMVGFVGASLAFLFLTAFGSYETYHLMETNSFCGETCHTPMEPEYKAYQHSAHAMVDCVACHIGPGTSAYIHTKVNGVKQLYHQIVGDYARPIQILNPNLRLAQETCQSCHWSQKHFGDLPKTYRRFLADENNTPFTVHMILKVGGSDPVHGPVAGIHSHMNVSNRIEFIALDEKRLEIPWVRVTDLVNGKVTEYRTENFKDDISKHSIRRMDCMDCHNRPAHNFAAPNDAVDQALAMGRIDPAIPWVKAKVVKALAQPYATREEAHRKIDSALRADYPDDKRVDALIKETLAIYKINFFPEMKADWRAHPNFIGHKDSNGCFRCHDGNHLASDGKSSIKGSDCNACHLIVAQGTGKELEKVDPKGTVFLHLGEEYSNPSCADCHNGQSQD